MRTVVLAALGVFVFVSAAGVANAEKLAIVGDHEVTGRVGDDGFKGTISIADDASFKRERTFASGRKDELSGQLKVVNDQLVLTPSAGIAGAVLGREAPAARVYAKAHRDGKLVWQHSSGAEVEEIVAGTRESALDAVKRALKEGRVLNWIFNDNRGLVDPDPDHAILRSREPRPDDILELVTRKKVKTIVSLNGDLDKTVTWYKQPETPGEPAPPAEKVNLREFIAARGIGHETFSLGASRAPTDDELVAIFKVLLDDSKKPILVHCRGGSDRTGIISAVYEIEFLGVSKEAAKKKMKEHLWASHRGTEIQGAYLDLYKPGHLRALLAKAGVRVPDRFAGGLPLPQ